MGKKRRALSAPQKFKARNRALRGSNPSQLPATTENSVAAATLSETTVSEDKPSSTATEVQITVTPEEVVSDFREANPLSTPVEEALPEETQLPPTIEAAPPQRPSAPISKKKTTRTRSVAKTKTPRTRNTRVKLADSAEPK